MFDHIIAKFPDAPTATFKVLGDSPTTQPKPCINGIEVTVPFNQVVTLPQPFLDVIVAAGHSVEQGEDDLPVAAEQPEQAAAEETTDTQETDAAAGSPAAEGAPDETLGGGSDASAGGSGEGTGAPATDPAPAFDADAVINGNVDTVVGRLSGLTDQQLIAVKAAEIDREKPRVGVTAALDAEIAARAEQVKGAGA